MCGVVGAVWGYDRVVGGSTTVAQCGAFKEAQGQGTGQPVEARSRVDYLQRK